MRLKVKCKSCPKFFGLNFEFSSILPLAPLRVQTYLTLVEEKLLFVSTLVCVSNSNLSLVFCVVIASKLRCEFLLEKLNGRCTGRGLGNQQTWRKGWMSVEQQLWQGLFILIIDCLCWNMRTTTMREYGEEKQEDGQFQNQNLFNIATDVFLLCGCGWCQQRQCLRFQNNSDDDDDYDDGDDNDSLRFWTWGITTRE